MAGPVTDAFMPATASSPTVSQLKTTTAQPDNEEISALIKLSQNFVRNRDFSSARLLLRRAAEAGSAAAALSLGETFDPLVIQQLHAIGVQLDPAKAREWYERAVQLGSDAASQHLAKLAQSPQLSGSANHARSASALANARPRSGPPLPSCATPISHTQSNLFHATYCLAGSPCCTRAVAASARPISTRENASMTALTHPGWGAARIIETPG